METSLERAWQEWEAFCTETEARIKASASSGLPPAPPENAALRAALGALDERSLVAFLDDPRLEETHLGSETSGLAATRHAMLLCFLPPHAAPTLALRYDDPFRAKTNLLPRPSLFLFLTLRWKAFLLANLQREYAVFTLHSQRSLIHHFVEKHGDEAAKALLQTTDPPALARELEKAQKQLASRPKP
jgi:hypothetical protein